MRRLELLVLALGNLRRAPLRVMLTAAGIAIATGSLVSMVGFALGVQTRVEAQFERLELLHRIDVTPRGEGSPPRANASTTGAASESALSADKPETVLDDGALAQIAALPGVALVYPAVQLDKVELEHGGRQATAPATGLPIEVAPLRFVRESIVAGRFLSAADAKQLVLGAKLLEPLGFASAAAAIGATVRLKAKGLRPDAQGVFRFEEQQIEMVVAGVWSPPTGRRGFASDGVVLPIPLLRRLPGSQFESALERFWRRRTAASVGYSRAIVHVDRPSDLYRVEEEIKKRGFHPRSFLSQLKEIRTGFVVLDLVLAAVGTVALVVAGLGIINTLLMSVLERYREIGTYKALGASDGDIRLLFLAEAGLVGLLGGIGGLALGRAVSAVMAVVINAIAHGRGVEEEVMTFAFPWQLLAGAVGFAMVVSVVSGIYPAGRAARVDPIVALRAD